MSDTEDGSLPRVASGSKMFADCVDLWMFGKCPLSGLHISVVVRSLS